MSDLILDFLQRTFLTICVLVGLIVVSVMDRNLNGKKDFNVTPVAILMLVLVIVNEVDYQSAQLEHFIHIRLVASAMGYVLRVSIAYAFVWIIDKSIVRKIVHYIPMVFTVLLVSTMFFNDWLVSFAEDNAFYRGPLYMLIYVPVAYYIILAIYKALSKEYIGGREGKFVLLCCAMITFITALLDTTVPLGGDMFFVAAAISLLFYYIFNLITTSKKKEIKYDKEIFQMESQLMLSQIQPHFINNTLATIRALNKTDPEKAGAVIDNFSAYLRSNLSNINKNEPIPFLEEIEHTKTYVEIEKVRFSNIDVEFELQVTDFKVPALSIQPLVENAIKHGVRARKRGRIKVKSFETELFYAVEIADNGKGFDVESLNAIGSDHYGIKNVKKRLEILADAEMRIYSVIDKGTVASIYIPKNK